MGKNALLATENQTKNYMNPLSAALLVFRLQPVEEEFS